MAEEVLNQEIRPTALVCANDPIAFSVLRLLNKLNLSCPDQISLVGFDNVGQCALLSPPITSIDPCKEQMGIRAVQLLLRRLEEPSQRQEQIRIVTDLVERSSVIAHTHHKS